MEQVSRISGVDPWRTLEALSFYRVVVCIALVVLASSEYRPPYFYGTQGPFIDATLFIYLFVAALLLVLVRGERPGHPWQSAIQISTDIGFIIVLDYATGGIGSGLAALLVTPVAAGSLLLDRRLSTVPPAIATIALLLVETYLNLEFAEFEEQYTQTGILGAGLFIIAISGSGLAKRARESEAEARRAHIDVAKLSALSESVIQKLQAGVIVCDADGHIELLNRAARKLLADVAAPGLHVSTCAPELWQRMKQWELDPTAPSSAAVQLTDDHRAWAQFTQLGRGPRASTLIVLDDASRVEEQAQAMKLASLGRLTASIAHELRNPLSAIQNAAELANESRRLDDEDRPLIEIIRRQTARLEEVISSVLSVSRKSGHSPQSRDLKELLDEAVSDFLQTRSQDGPDIRVDVPHATQVLVEPVQLVQILHNLLENACTHASVNGKPPRIEIDATLSANKHDVVIELRDDGPGIAKNLAGQVFEPFFSTSHTGTGLGLFITRELCEAANGKLLLVNDRTRPGATFRLVFPAAPGKP